MVFAIIELAFWASASSDILFSHFLMEIAYLVDDIGWAIVYFKNKELLTKDE